MMATTVTVYFATNRQPLTDGGDRIVGFTSELGPTAGLDFRYGRAQVEVDLKNNQSTFVPGSLEVAEQKLLFAAGGNRCSKVRRSFDAIREDMAKSKRPTITLIHGFSNSFADAIERAGWILVFYGIDANIFAWRLCTT